MKVYLDMDRVIADFDNGVREYAHIEPPDQKTKNRLRKCGKNSVRFRITMINLT